MTGVQTCALPICFPVTIRGSGATQGTSRAGRVFGYGVFTLFDASFHTLHLTFPVPHRGPTTPGGQVLLVWAVPLSFATTEGIAFAFYSSAY